MSGAGRELLAVCGVDLEVKRVSRFVDGCLTSGGRPGELRAMLQDLHEGGQPIVGLISIGLCGGLDPALRAGQLVCAQTVYDGAFSHPADPAWRRRLIAATGAAPIASILGFDRPATTPEAKADLHRVSRAEAVDMESHVVADHAEAMGLPFAVLRVVSDDAAHGIPASAVAGMAADGSVNVLAVLGGLARRPADLPALLRLSRETGRALKTLEAAAAAAGPGLCFSA